MSTTDDVGRERELEKSEAIEAIEDALTTLDATTRELDRWQRTCLVQAIGALYRGGYRLALANADLAVVPAQERTSLNLRPDPFIDRCDIVLLRTAFVEAKEQPIMLAPVFGPIRFTG
jgi:hypothetical protein